MTNISRAAQNAKVKTLSKNSALSLRKLPERHNPYRPKPYRRSETQGNRGAFGAKRELTRIKNIGVH
jgi:hypothetical protein